MAGKVQVIDRDLGWGKVKQVFAEKGDKPSAVRVGIQGDGAVKTEGGMSLVDIATVHEFGSTDGRIPQRSFIRSTFDKNKKQYQKLVNEMARQVLDGKVDADSGLGLIGQKFVADVKKTIRDGIEPPLAQSTIAGRTKKIKALAGNANQSAATAAAEHLENTGELPAGAVTPLIDTGRLINSIRSTVER